VWVLVIRIWQERVHSKLHFFTTTKYNGRHTSQQLKRRKMQFDKVFETKLTDVAADFASIHKTPITKSYLARDLLRYAVVVITTVIDTQSIDCIENFHCMMESSALFLL
jgi:hypothetical protein